jgi:hypothetical protein
MHLSKRVLRAALGIAVTAIGGACADAPTAPPQQAGTRPSLNLGAPQKLESCDAFSITCDRGTFIPVDNRIYLHSFIVTNCDRSLDYTCSPYCSPYDQTCFTQQVDGDYYEIRQNLYEANGTWLGYNSQKWHGWAGTVDIPIYDTRMCATSGRHLNVEIYHIGPLNTLERKASFNVYPSDRDRTLIEGSIRWVAHINYHWDAC